MLRYVHKELKFTILQVYWKYQTLKPCIIVAVFVYCSVFWLHIQLCISTSLSLLSQFVLMHVQRFVGIQYGPNAKMAARLIFFCLHLN